MNANLVQRGIYLVSAVVCLVVGFLILGPRPAWVAGAVDVSALPTVNASLNALTTVALLAGLVAVKSRRVTVHRAFMGAAFALSTSFLTTYVVYHWFKAGPAVYEGSFRLAYLVILLTHIVLAAVILPLALTTLSWAVMGSIDRHRRIAPWTLGIWLYVSVTGVLIYAMVHL